MTFPTLDHTQKLENFIEERKIISGLTVIHSLSRSDTSISKFLGHQLIFLTIIFIEKNVPPNYTMMSSLLKKISTDLTFSFIYNFNVFPYQNNILSPEYSFWDRQQKFRFQFGRHQLYT